MTKPDIKQRLLDALHGVSYEVRNKRYIKKPLSQLAKSQAIQLVNELYSPEERFAQGFFKYRVDILKHPEQFAWENTLEELETYKQGFIEHLDDPCVQTIGYVENGEYHAVGIYCLRDLEAHYRGSKVLDAIDKNGLNEKYHGNLAILHSFSLLKGHRNLEMLKLIFILIATEALEKNYQHIFFYMSDHRLKTIYQRYGLEFPDCLSFEDTKHVIGSYSLNTENLQKVEAVVNTEGFSSLITETSEA